MDFSGKYRRIIILLFIFTLGKTYAQDTLNTAFVEKQSHQLYIDKNWNELISFSNKAIKKDFDYYYLRLRLGIAYYEKKKYLFATKQFQKALTFYSGDNLSKEYLYYCYIYSGRYVDARVLSKSFDTELIAKTGIDKISSLALIQMSGGVKQPSSSYLENPHLEQLNNIRNNDSITVNKTDSIHYSTAKYFQVALGHYVKNRIYLFHAFTYFNQESSHYNHGFKTFDLHDPPPFPVNSTNHFSAPIINNNDDITNQYQYYLGANIPLKKNWSISPAVHYISSNILHKTENTVFGTIIGHPPMGPPTVLEVPFNPKLLSSQSTSHSSYFVEAFTLSKYISNLSLALGNTFSNINNTKRVQSTLSISYAPFGNNQLVIGCDAHYVYTIDSAEGRAAISPYITFMPTSKISFTLNYLVDFNDKQKDDTNNNIIEGNGLFINNSSDKTLSRLSIIGNIPAGKHLDFFAIYTYENNLTTLPVPADKRTNLPVTLNSYYNSFFIGIRIKNFNKFTNK